MYINTETNEYPLTKRDIKERHSNISFPKDFTPLPQYSGVVITPKPVFDPLVNRVVEVAPLLVGNTWTQQWSLVPAFVVFVDEEGVTQTVEAQTAAATARLHEKALNNKVQAIEREFTDSVGTLKTGYTNDEIKSWDKQEAEAVAVLADPAAPTPLLTAMVAVRGDTVAELAAIILGNAAAYTAAYGAMLGQKHMREATLAGIDLNAADALAQIEAV